MPTDTKSGVRSAFRASAARRLDLIEAAWSAALSGSREFELDPLFDSIRDLRADARMLGYNDVSLVCHKLERLIDIAREGMTEINQEVEMLGAMAITFARMLVQHRDRPVSGLDLAGFIAEIDEAIRDAERAIRRREVQPPSPRDFGDPASSRPIDLTGGSPMALSRSATDMYLATLSVHPDLMRKFDEAWHTHANEVCESLKQGLESRLDRYHVLTQQAADAAGKTVEFRPEVSSTKIHADRATLLDRVISQLLGNAVEHGVERSAARTIIGKKSWGLLTLAVRDEDHEAVVIVEDDGAGIDRSALRRAFPEASDADLLQKIFEKGYTTRAATSRAGKVGRGLAMVRSTVEQLDGELHVRSQPSVGTRITVRIPIPSSSFEAWGFRARGRRFAVDGGFVWSEANPDEASEAHALCGSVPPRDTETPASAFRFMCDGEEAMVVRADGPPTRVLLTAKCPTLREDPAEIMLDGEEIVVFVRSAKSFSWGEFWSESTA